MDVSVLAAQPFRERRPPRRVGDVQTQTARSLGHIGGDDHRPGPGQRLIGQFICPLVLIAAESGLGTLAAAVGLLGLTRPSLRQASS